MKLQKKKIALRKKIIKHGSVRVVKRAKYIDPFIKVARKMSKKDLIKLVATSTNFNSSLFTVSYDMLQKLYGMTKEKINHEVSEYHKHNDMLKDSRLYYHGKITATSFINKYGKLYGIDTKDKLDDFVKKDLFEVPDKIGYQKIVPEKIVIEKRYQSIENPIEDRDTHDVFTIPKRSDPAGQRQPSIILIHDYMRLLKDLNHKLSTGQISQAKVNLEKTRYLLDLAISRPEYSAIVAYMIFNKDAKITDDFDKMKNQFLLFGKGTKFKFIELMKNYIMEKDNSPPQSEVWNRGSWVINGKREKLAPSYSESVNKEKLNHKTKLQLIKIEEDIREKEFLNKLAHSKYIELHEKHPDKYPTIESYNAQKNLLVSKHIPTSRSEIDKTDSNIMKEVIGNEDTEHYYNSEERRKRRLKVIKRPIKKLVKKPIKKVIKKCRCK